MPLSFQQFSDRPSWQYLAATNQIANVGRFASLGYNDDIDTTDIPEDVTSASAVGILNGIDHKQIQLPGAAGVSMEAVSTSASDSSAGIGARTISVTYLDTSLNQLTQTVTLNGTTAVALTGTIYRIVSCIVVTVGSSETNVGAISIRLAGGLGAVYSHILAGFGIAQSSLLTVPADRIFDWLFLLCSVHSVDTTARSVSLATVVRSPSGRRFIGPFLGFNSAAAPFVHNAGGLPLNSFTAGTDIWLRVNNINQSNGAVSAGLYGILR